MCVALESIDDILNGGFYLRILKCTVFATSAGAHWLRIAAVYIMCSSEATLHILFFLNMH